MSESDTIQSPIPFSFRGKDYPVAVCSLKHEIAFQDHLKREARAEVTRCRARAGQPYDLSHEDVRLLLEIYLDRCASGAYDWTGRVAWEARQTESGSKELCFLLLASETPSVRRDLLDHIFADPAARGELLALYWRSVNQARPQTPATGAPPPDPA